MRNITVLLLILFSSQQLFAQYSVSGKITDGNKPLASTTVSLYRPDTTLVKSALSGKEGEFTMTGIQKGLYHIIVSNVGYQMSITSVSIQNANKVIDIKLVPDPKALQGVTVTATKPFLEQRADKLIVNVENNATAAGSTALEILQKVPGVLVLSDKLTLVGKSSVLILIDGRSSAYTDMNQVLRDMPSSNIEKIEVITNPGAKYEASGGAVINIILKKTANLGTNGTVSLVNGLDLFNKRKNGLDQTFYRIAPSINLNHRKGSWNLYGGYSFLHREFFERNQFDRVIDSNLFRQKNYAVSNINSHNYRLGADYFVNKKNTVGVLFRGFYRTGTTETSNTTEQTKANTGQAISGFRSRNDEEFKRTNFAANLNWKHLFDTAGRELNLDIDYSHFNLDNTGIITNFLSNGTTSVNDQIVDNPVKFAVGKMDYTHPLTKSSKIESGVRISAATIDNDFVFKRNATIDNALSSDFLYQEKINAAYLTYQNKFNRWEFIGGLRTEQTIAEGTSGGVKNLNRSYWQLFPSAFLTRQLNASIAAALQYSRRVDRPSYQQQNPFIFFNDSLTYTRGNPLLRPEITDATKFLITYQSQPLFSVSYNVTKDAIVENAPQQEGIKTYATPQNLARFENVAIELNFPIKIGKKISGFGGNQFINNHYKAAYLGGIYDQSRWNWLVYGQVAYKPSATWNIEASFLYMTKFLSEFLIISPLGNVNLAVQKTLWEKKGRISLNVSDMFYTNKIDASILYQEINVRFKQFPDTRTVRLSFTYSFGNQKLRATRNRSTAAENETNRVKQ